jgi:AP-2 complex subunit mu-1
VLFGGILHPVIFLVLSLIISFVNIGSVLRCDVTGKILMKCFLSGMPDLKLGLNDKIGLEKESQLKARPTKR